MLRQEAAETIALQALSWLLSNEDLLPSFLNASGASTSDLAVLAQKPAFLTGVLDFLLTDDAWVIAFCDAAGLPYTHPMAAREALPGGAQTHWT